jgi:hypothetical protein
LATYSLSPRTKIQSGYRHLEVDRAFIGGGRLIDYWARRDLMLSYDFALSAYLKQERWNFPALSPAPHSNLTASFQFTFYPTLRSDRQK